MQPPPTPAVILARVQRRARFNGASVIVIACIGTLLCAAGGEFGLAVVGLAVAAAGAAERHGASLLGAREPQGVDWLVASQVYLLVAILAYSLWRIARYDQALVVQAATAASRIPLVRQSMAELGIAQRDLVALLRKSYYLTYMILAAATFLYQGGLALYYHRRRGALTAAVSERS